MQITFLIGNGFDVGLGLPTRYKDFYPIYCKTDVKDTDNIYNFKQILRSYNADEKSGILNWSDFEKAFGEHSIDETINSKKDYLDRFKSFVINFNRYLELVEKCVNYSANSKIAGKLDKAMSAYKQIRREDADELNTLYSKFDKERIYNFISFNYTNTVDKCSLIFKNFLGVHNNRRVGVVLHVHGYIHDSMIVGVNDSSQIINPDFATDEDVIRNIVKPQQNISARTGYENDAKKIIDVSNIICVYGMSLGDTDKIWWEYISQWLLKGENKALVILAHNDLYSKRFPFQQDSYIRPVLEKFLSFSNLSKEEKNVISKKIYIDVNNDVFEMDLFEKDKFKEELEKFQLFDEYATL